MRKIFLLLFMLCFFSNSCTDAKLQPEQSQNPSAPKSSETSQIQTEQVQKRLNEAKLQISKQLRNESSYISGAFRHLSWHLDVEKVKVEFAKWRSGPTAKGNNGITWLPVPVQQIYKMDSIKMYYPDGSLPFKDIRYTSNQRHVFFNEPMPVVLVVGIDNRMGNTAYHILSDGWINLFGSTSALSGVPQFSQTVTLDSQKRHKILAQAIVLSAEGSDFEVLEIHYSSKSDKPYEATFKSNSKYDQRTGFKTSENEPVGQKEKDYFFIWPVTSGNILMNR